ncbi:hypothetical protein A1O3_03383 [Capronia epimyces CBS 606.96]|uniref:Zn(2)-C6 fungal-type domain-containing protein n=1 Tax=Capronia epimyces CBS 606.96 TaxID=1182542 RepID=W9Y0W4_9EURO|nr:uncharacterized protein A1O3_03383 [Capronia epimyces CBS 606.96]EXJ86432.1 hypothetical protein A1O3_03383 [Capronia epimyces CBS 606.96]
MLPHSSSHSHSPSRPRQPPPSRGSKLGYYRASIACVGCRRSKTRCLLTPSREQDSCLNCRRKNQPCAFLTVDKKPPDWVRSKGRPTRSESTSASESESSASSQLSVSPSTTALNVPRDYPGSGDTDAQASQQQRKQRNLLVPWDGNVHVPEFSFGTLPTPTPEAHADLEGWVYGNLDSFVSLDHMGNTNAGPTIPQYSGLSPSPGLGWDINALPLEYPYNPYPLETGQFYPAFDPAALARLAPYGDDGYSYQISGAGT